MPIKNTQGFDIEKLETYATHEIRRFARDYEDEMFYAFAISDGLLCLNSFSEFEKTLAKYQQMLPEYKNEAEKDIIKQNVGDWRYKGFANLQEQAGFDYELWDEFYKKGFFGIPKKELEEMQYYKAMQELLQHLLNNRIFENNFHLTEDFRTFILMGND